MAEHLTRRTFIKVSVTVAGTASLGSCLRGDSTIPQQRIAPGTQVTDLPSGAAPPALHFSHFPDRFHAYVWRNWELVPIERLAAVVRTNAHEILRAGRGMGLSTPPRITEDQQRRSFITVIRRNWHLLPYEQLLELLAWTPERMAFTLMHDDFLFAKLGRLKPRCEPLTWTSPDSATLQREGDVARVVQKHFPEGLGESPEAPFQFLSDLSTTTAPRSTTRKVERGRFSPSFCYSYFALYGDPLLDDTADPYPDEYLDRLAATGVDGVWIPTLLRTLAPFPWDPTLSARYSERLKNLRELVSRARKHGMGIYLYVNEPRSMPLSFFETRPQLKGIVSGDRAALCTSHPDVQEYLVEAIASVCRVVPDLAGLFTITASENMTNCWYANTTPDCPRCSRRSAAEVIGEVNRLISDGISRSGSKIDLIAWDWGWADEWVEDIINRLPRTATFMSVSEWSIPIERGGVKSAVGEYSMSTVGPGHRATRFWGAARKRGLKTIAKIQAGNTWELSATPYIPAVENVAQHAVNLRQAGVDGLMLSWTLGGYPSPNLEVVSEVGRNSSLSAADAMERVAVRRFGEALAPAVVKAWREFSKAFREFPFGTGLYFTPMQAGPSNLLWERPTGYSSTMVGFPYDDLDGWRACYPTAYPAKTFIGQFEKIAEGFESALADLKAATRQQRLSGEPGRAVAAELSVAEAATIHFRSTANQSRFVDLRHDFAVAKTPGEKESARQALKVIVLNEIALARRLHAIQIRDSRIGFEASNQYLLRPSGSRRKGPELRGPPGSFD